MDQQTLIGYVKKCQICGHEGLDIVLDLGHHPPVHAHLTAVKLNEPETTYPLRFCRCPDCGLLQLDYIVDPKIVFPPEYPYQTGLTNMLVRNFRQLAEVLTAQYKTGTDDLIIDIGSNDGTLLQGFKDKGMKVLGIEPTDVAKLANERGIETLQEYVTEDTAKRVVEKYGQAKLITAANVFAHINNLYELVAAIKTMLKDDGIFVSESQYLMDIVEKLEFDTIYHEHLRFYSLKPLAKLFELSGMSLVDAERITAAGGSIRVYAMKGQHEMSQRAKDLIASEEKAGMYDLAELKKFADRALKARRKLVMLLLQLKEQGAHIVGIGGPARSNTLLNFCKIDSTMLDYSGEKNGSPKIGLFAPGSHIPIFDEAKMFAEQPEYGFLQSWHIGEELVKKLKELGYKGKFIMPLPEPRIIE